MDPPPEGCPLCGSTWGNYWQEVQGKLEFFCCELCAIQWVSLLDQVKGKTSWPVVDRVDVSGNRWGRTCVAHHGEETLRFSIAFTPEGKLRSFAVNEEPPREAPVAEETRREPTLHPKLLERLEYEAENYPDPTSLPVEEGRKLSREIARELDALAGGAPAVSQIRTTSFPLPGHRVPARVYTPTNGEAPFPVVLYFHGGGWVFGDLETHDSVCREIANRSQSVVISVAYRRAPEHKFPEPVDDCVGALNWATDPAIANHLEINPARVAVAGDSAGGNMAAVVALIAKETSGPRIAGQVLICPVIGYYPDTASYRENATGMGLEESFMPWMWDQYLRSPEDGRNPHVSPLLAPEVTGLPPALVITAECDILRDEAEHYAERLWKAGVPVKLTRYPGMLHGFIDYRGLVKEGWRALDEIAGWLRVALAR